MSTGIDVQAHTKEDIMQAQTTRRHQEFGFNRIILGALVGIGLVAATIFAIQALKGGETASQTRELAPVNLIQEDPPLADDWVDPYFTDGASNILILEDPPLPDDWVDPYFNRPAVIPEQQDPPLPEGWVDPYFSSTD